MENIYELLNHAELNLEEFEHQKLSDYERKMAKKQVREEIRKSKNRVRIWKKTLAAAAACACIIIGTGTICAAAGWLPVPDAFRTIFGIRTDEELETANTMGVAADAVAKDHGYKVSAEGIIGDGKNIGIVFQIEKSDGSTLLDSGEVPVSVDFREINSEEDAWLKAVTEHVAGSSQAHCIEYYLAFTYRDSEQDHIWISLEDMQLRAGDEQVDVSGTWEFDIPFEIQDVSVDLAAGQKFTYGSSEGVLDELRISPIGFSVRITTTDKLSDSDFIDLPMEMRLKNGETVELDGGCGPEDNEDGTWSWREDGIFENLILLEHVDSIVIGDTEFEMK